MGIFLRNMKGMVSEKVKFKDGWPLNREDSGEGG